MGTYHSFNFIPSHTLFLGLTGSLGLMRSCSIFRHGIVTAAVTAGLGWAWDLRNRIITAPEGGRERVRE